MNWYSVTKEAALDAIKSEALKLINQPTTVFANEEEYIGFVRGVCSLSACLVNKINPEGETSDK